jgi:hypothetical protein
MALDHEYISERLTEATDELRSPLAGKHPLLEQLLHLGIELLIAWLTGQLPKPTPPPTKPVPRDLAR